MAGVKRELSGVTASILKDSWCGDCGWPIVDACCNGLFCSYADAARWDWWVYCSNKGCKNHNGNGVFQDKPNWVVTISK